MDETTMKRAREAGRIDALTGLSRSILRHGLPNEARAEYRRAWKDTMDATETLNAAFGALARILSQAGSRSYCEYQRRADLRALRLAAELDNETFAADIRAIGGYLQSARYFLAY